MVCPAVAGFAKVEKRVRTAGGGSTGSVRNLRIREDTAKYLLNLDPNSGKAAGHGLEGDVRGTRDRWSVGMALHPAVTSWARPAGQRGRQPVRLRNLPNQPCVPPPQPTTTPNRAQCARTPTPRRTPARRRFMATTLCARVVRLGGSRTSMSSPSPPTSAARTCTCRWDSQCAG